MAKDNVSLLLICKVVCIALLAISGQFQQPNRQKLKLKTIKGGAISITEYFLLFDGIRQVLLRKYIFFQQSNVLYVQPFLLLSANLNCSRLDFFHHFLSLLSFFDLETFLFLHLNILKLFLLDIILQVILLNVRNILFDTI